MDDKPDFKFEKTLITPEKNHIAGVDDCLLYTSPSPRDS